MKNSLFDHWLNKKLEDSSVPFDKEMEWSLLLPKIQQKKKKRRLVYWILLPLFSFGFGVYYYTVNQKYEVIANEKLQEIETPTMMSNVSNDKQDIEQSRIQLKSNIETNINKVDVSTIKRIQQRVEINTRKIQSHQNQVAHFNGYQSNSSTLLHLNNNVNVVQQTMDSIERASKILNKYTQFNSDKIVKPDIIIPNNIASLLYEVVDFNREFSYSFPFLEQKLDAISIDDPIPILKLEMINSPNPLILESNRKHRSNFELVTNISYGRLFQSLKGESKIVSARQMTEKALDIFSIQCLAQRKIYNQFSVRSGFEWNRATVGFHQQFKDTVKTNLYGQIILEKIDAQSVSTFDTGTTSVTQYRNVKRNHYNHRTQFNIPIYLNYTFLLNKRWNIKPHIGIGIPVFQSFNGQVVDSEHDPLVLSEYGKNVSFFPFSCSYRYGMEVAYSIKDYLNLNIGLSRNDEFRSWEESDHSIREKHGSFQVQFGIFYKIK